MVKAFWLLFLNLPFITRTTCNCTFRVLHECIWCCFPLNNEIHKLLRWFDCCLKIQNWNITVLATCSLLSNSWPQMCAVLVILWNSLQRKFARMSKFPGTTHHVIVVSSQYATTRTLLVRNIGNSDAKFQLLVQEPFFVTPDSGRLAIGDSMQIHVDFKAMQTGDHGSHMILQYETGMFNLYNYLKFLFSQR